MIVLDGYIFFIENEYLSKDDVLYNIGTEKAYQFLLEFEYLKKMKGGFSFHFVGIISVNDRVICVLPKYFSSEELNSHKVFSNFVKIVKVLKKAGATEPSIPDFNNFSTSDYDGFSEFVIADKLIKDYLEHGLIYKFRSLSGYNTDGEVNWDETIGATQPIFSNNRPVYVDTYNLSIINEGYNVITEIHKWVIKTSLTKYGRILDYNFTFQEECSQTLTDLGTLGYLTGLLRKELNERYIDRDILLIKWLLSYISKEDRSSKNTFTVYGTGYYHTIWEKCCSAFFNNKIDQFKQFIPTPKWSDIYGNASEKESLIPDIITYISNKSVLFILDAKYYNLRYSLEPFKVINNPGISDVTKQFLYYQLFASLPYETKLNGFIFPSSQEDVFKVAGTVTFPLFSGLKIFNIYLSSDLAYDSYLNNKALDEQSLKVIAAGLSTIN